MAQWNRPMGRPFNSKPVLNGHMMEKNRPPPLMSHYHHDDSMMPLPEPLAQAPLPRQPLAPPPPPHMINARRGIEMQDDNLYDHPFSSDHRPPPLMPLDDYYDDDNPPLPLPDIPPSHIQRQGPPAFDDYPEAPPIIHSDRPIHRYPRDDIAVYDHHQDHPPIKYPPHMDNPHPHDRPMTRQTRPEVNPPIPPQYDDYDYPPFNHSQRPQPPIHQDDYDEERMMPSYHHPPIPPSPQPRPPPSGPYGRSPNLGHPRPRPPLPHSPYPPLPPSDDWPTPPRHQPPLPPPLPPPQHQPPLPPSLPPPVHMPIGSNAKKHHSAPDSVTIDSLLLPPSRSNRPSQVQLQVP